jgi:phosphoribosyl 1,2-cyclic phosphodiesterase
VKVKVWGARGSVPSPGPETNRYGGNTSCVQVTADDGTTVVLDGGTGIRNLGMSLEPNDRPLHILLTHLHLDHIQGLMFFAPLFRPESEITIWGPASPEAPLMDRIARYISAPLAPVEVRELPCHLAFNEAEPTEWEIEGMRIRADSVTHRGPTLGYRIQSGEQSVCYIPDHEPGLGVPICDTEDDWISGFDLAQDAGLLLHDCQYTDAEHQDHLGWGHSPLTDALEFGRRTRAERVVLFHHDPLHTDDFLDALSGQAIGRWQELGGRADQVELAAERREIVLTPAAIGGT